VRTETIVRRYKRSWDYEADAKSLIAQGWSPAGQFSQGGRVRLGRSAAKAAVFLPWAVIKPSRKKDAITVTWVRQVTIDPATAARAAAAAAARLPRWGPDPWARHEQRWWNGRRWSEHVADAGERSIDSEPIDELAERRRAAREPALRAVAVLVSMLIVFVLFLVIVRPL
jgi:hypothetical protein